MAFIQQPPLAVERVVETLLAMVVLIVLATVLVTLVRAGWAGGARWIRRRRCSLARGESAFVARVGLHGPELFAVGDGVRRLSIPREPGAPVPGRAGGFGPALAAGMLLEILGRPPSRELTWAFVEERLGYLPIDGFVLPAAEVMAWVDTRHPEPSKLRGGAVRAAGACTAVAAAWRRPPRRSKAGDRIPGGPSGA